MAHCSNGPASPTKDCPLTSPIAGHPVPDKLTASWDSRSVAGGTLSHVLRPLPQPGAALIPGPALTWQTSPLLHWCPLLSSLIPPPTALQLSPPVDKGHPKSRAMLCLLLGWSMAYNQHLIIAKGVALFIVTMDFAFSGNRLPCPFCARLLALSLGAVSSQARTRLLSCLLTLTHDSRPLPLLLLHASFLMANGPCPGHLCPLPWHILPDLSLASQM